MNKQAFERITTLASYARERRANSDFEEAGSFYVASAHGWLSGIRHHPNELSEKFDTTYHLQTFVARGVRSILAACLCFRISGQQSRARTQGEMALAVVSDLMNHEERFSESENRARQGLAHEMVGDVRLFADIGGHEEAYNTAIDVYEPVDSYEGWQAEDEFNLLIQPAMELADGISYDIDADSKYRIEYTSLPERAEFKRDHYETILRQVIDEGGWDSEVF